MVKSQVSTRTRNQGLWFTVPCTALTTELLILYILTDSQTPNTRGVFSRASAQECLPKFVLRISKIWWALALLNRCHVEEFSVVDEDFFCMHYFIPIDSDFYASSEGDHTPSSYLRTILPKWKKLVQTSQLKPGSPLVLIITSSAIRAVHLNRFKHYLWIIQ